MQVGAGGSAPWGKLSVFRNDKSVLEMNSNILTSCLAFFPFNQTSPFPFPTNGWEEFNLTNVCLSDQWWLRVWWGQRVPSGLGERVTPPRAAPLPKAHVLVDVGSSAHAYEFQI